MPASPLARPNYGYGFGSLLTLLVILLVSGCTSPNHRTAISAEQLSETALPVLSDDWLPVARRGRYTLVTLKPKLSQHNLLLQEIHVAMPAGAKLTVGDGLRRVLQRSGYALCDESPATELLFSLPLPAPHYQLGPVLLQDALQTLAGPAWTLQVDLLARQVCFGLVEDHQSTAAGSRP